MICIHCGFEFDENRPRHKAKGKISECAECADDVAKTVGVIDGVEKSDVRIILQREPKEDVNNENAGD